MAQLARSFRARRRAAWARRVALTAALLGTGIGLLPAAPAAAVEPPTEIAIPALPVVAPVGADFRDLPLARRTAFLAVDGIVLVAALERSASSGVPVGVDLFPGRARQPERRLGRGHDRRHPVVDRASRRR